MKEFIAILDEMYKWVDEIPPIKQKTRFGNKAYRIWNARLLAVCRAYPLYIVI